MEYIEAAVNPIASLVGFGVEKASWEGMLPKSDTESLQFIKDSISEHGNKEKKMVYDGRDIIVGILDTGVDPIAIGLNSKTTTGKQKVIDIIDCTGSGDVAMSKPITAIPFLDMAVIIKAPSGREITVNKNWVNPTNQYRLGQKRAYELYPKALKERVVEERKKKLLSRHHMIESNLQRNLIDAQSDKSTTSESIDDLKEQLSQLTKMLEKEEDVGPVYDCIVYHDGVNWQAAVDTSELGDFSSASSMCDYRIKYEYGTFSEMDSLNYCVNVYDDGDILSIVTDAGAHGSHVAGIVAAHHPNAPELNGIAPGAQIVSLKIGDTRLGSMETGVGLTRALIEAVKRKCDILNMSYGEAVTWEDSGAFIELVTKIVNEHNIIFVASAGNNGPALSTVGCPGGTSSACIGVGAYVTSSLMNVAYSLREKLPVTNYTWSSAGPCIDGDLGVSIMAPGGAITSVPAWTLSRNQLMNGTSMSSPNACGCIALLLSAAKQNGIHVTPIRMRRAVEGGALFVDGVSPLGQGHGLIQVKKSWKLFREIKRSDDWLDIPYSVKINSERFTRGIYLRQNHETTIANTFAIQVDPIFHPTNHSAADKTRYEVRIRLVLGGEGYEKWISIPERLHMNSGGKTFAVMIDSRNLPSGLHHTMVKAYDENSPIKCPIFEFPVTVIKPEVVTSSTNELVCKGLSLGPAERYRRFVSPPTGSCFVDIVITDPRGESSIGTEDSSSRNIVVHCLQVFRGSAYSSQEKKEYISLTPKTTTVVSMPIYDEQTLEICIARQWNTIGDTVCDVSVTFRGITPFPNSVTLIGGSKVSEIIRVLSPLSKNELLPTAKLDKWTSIVKPISAGKVAVLGDRDVLPSGERLYGLILEYEFEINEACDAVLRFPGLQKSLYESQFHAQLVMLYNARKKLVAVRDAFPSKIKLGKGKYVARLQIRHSSLAQLEAVNDMPAFLERSLKNPVSLSFFKSKEDAMAASGDKDKTRNVSKGGSLSYFIKEPPADVLPKGASAGDILNGYIFYIKKGQNGTGGWVNKTGGFDIRYVVNDCAVKAESKNDISAKVAEKEKEMETVESVVRDAKIKYLKSLVGKKRFDDLYHTMEPEYAYNLQIKQAMLQHRIKMKHGEDYATINDIVDAANALEGMIRKDKVAIAMGTNYDKSDVDATIKHKEFELQKSLLIELYTAKAYAALDILLLLTKYLENAKTREMKPESFNGAGLLSDTSGISVTINDDDDDEARHISANDFNIFDGSCEYETSENISANIVIKENMLIDTIKCLEKWDDITKDDKYTSLYIHKLKYQMKYGLALKRVNELLLSVADTSKSTSCTMTRDDLLRERESILKVLKWDHFLEIVSKQRSVTDPESYQPF